MPAASPLAIRKSIQGTVHARDVCMGHPTGSHHRYWSWLPGAGWGLLLCATLLTLFCLVRNNEAWRLESRDGDKEGAGRRRCSPSEPDGTAVCSHGTPFCVSLCSCRCSGKQSAREAKDCRVHLSRKIFSCATKRKAVGKGSHS